MSDLILQEPRNIVSPRQGNRHGSRPPLRAGTSAFEEALCEVVETVKATEQGSWSTEFLAKGNPTELGGTVPRLIAKKLRLGSDNNPRPKNLALAVSMDKPWHLGEFIHDELIDLGYHYKIHREGTVQFCDPDASMMAFMTDLHTSTAAALDKVFDIKYYWKRPRPEDHLKVHGSIFTVNGYSAPGHWTAWAGHGAAAGATAVVVLRHFDLPADVMQEVIHACWVFAHGRTFLGVHFHEDNAEGFQVGTEF